MVGAVGRVSRWLSGATTLLAISAVMRPVSADVNVNLRPVSQLPVDLVQPVDGEVLHAGHPATVEWFARHDLSELGLLEWEAFLSFDGGASWPVRVTPHLDIDVSSFRFRVPSVPSEKVRLMLRFGDEQDEVGYVLPLVLRSVVRTGGWTAPSLLALKRGEAALPGAEGVVQWVEGPRDGRWSTIRVASHEPPEVAATRSVWLSVWPVAVQPVRSGVEAGRREVSGPYTVIVPGGELADPPVQRSSFCLLRLLCRQNE
jgi:hypothetical protein